MTAYNQGDNRGATIPVDRLAAGAAAADASEGSHAPVQEKRAGVRILLVDDHEDTNRAMQRLLVRLGYHVRTAHSVQTAIAAAADGPPVDLLISDIGLPDGTGLELLRRLTVDGAHPMKAIALSGFGMDEDITRSKAAGFHHHLTKPISFKRLETAIRQLTA